MENLALVSEHQYLFPFNPSPAMHRVQNLARQDDPEPLAYFTRGGEIVTNNRGEPLGKFLLILEWWTDTLPRELIATIRDAYEGSLNMGKDSELRKRYAHEVTDQEWEKIANKLIRLERKARLKCSGLSRKESHDKVTNQDLWAGHWWSWEAPGDEVEQSQRLRDIVTVDDICERRKWLDKYPNGAKNRKDRKRPVADAQCDREASDKYMLTGEERAPIGAALYGDNDNTIFATTANKKRKTVDEVDHYDDAPVKKARRALTASYKEARAKKAARSRAETIQVNRPSSPSSLPLLPPLAPSPVQTYENSLLPRGQLTRPSRSTHEESEDTATAQEDYNGLGSAYRLAASGFEPAYKLAPQGAARGVGNESSTYGPNMSRLSQRH